MSRWDRLRGTLETFFQIGKGGPNISGGTGTPEGSVTGSPGDLYLSKSGGTGTTVYYKGSGSGTNTGWVAVSSGSTSLSAKVYNSSSTAVSDSTFTTLPWDTESWDVGGLHDNVTNNSRLTAPATGKYLVSATITIEQVSGFPSSGDRRELRIVKNGGGANSIMTTVQVSPFDGIDTILNMSALVSLSAGDYLEVVGYQNSGGNLNFGWGDVESAHFEMVYVSG